MNRDRPAGEAEARASSFRSRLGFAGLMLLLTFVFVGLGTWQVQRLFWKLDLIERVETRVHAPAVPAPSLSEWAEVAAATDEYRHVTAKGFFDHDKSALVQAVTERGAGFWVLTPLRLDDGSTILINRGFMPAARSARDARLGSELAAGPVSVTGLLRISEPGGGFLRSNDPANDRWFSRDVAAIAEAKALKDVAPYFIDADGTPNAGGLPIGGLTVIAFRNSHLVYALTWYSLAIMSAAAAWFILRRRVA